MVVGIPGYMFIAASSSFRGQTAKRTVDFFKVRLYMGDGRCFQVFWFGETSQKVSIRRISKAWVIYNRIIIDFEYYNSPKKDPWDWYIYLHEWLMFMVNVGKYTTIMGGLGQGIRFHTKDMDSYCKL